MAYLDNNGLLYLWQQLKTKLAAKADSTDVPTKTSDLTNDSGFITSADVPEGAAASTTTPKMDGTAATGSETAFARGDHVHPTDTSRQAKITASGILKGNGSGTVSAAVSGTDYQAPLPTQTGNSGKYLTTDGSDLSWGTVDAFPTQSGNSGKYLTTNGSAVSWGSISIPTATSTSPKMDGTAAVGTETTWAKGDHVHPTDTSRAPLASPGLTGTPTAPTATAGDNSTQIATLGDQIQHTTFSVLVAWVPVLHGRVLHLCTVHHDNLYDSSVQLILIAHRGRTSFQITYVSIVIGND